MSRNPTKPICHTQKTGGGTKPLVISATIDTGFALRVVVPSLVIYIVGLQYSEATVVQCKQKAMSETRRAPKSGSGFRINLAEAPFATACKLGFTVPIRQCHLIQGERHDCDVSFLPSLPSRAHTRARSPDVSVHSIPLFCSSDSRISLPSRTLRILSVNLFDHHHQSASRLFPTTVTP